MERPFCQGRGWPAGARGKAVKVASFLRPKSQAGYACRVIFMRRARPGVLASQRATLALHERV